MSKWMKTCHTNSKTYLVILVQYLGVSENLRLDNERPWKEINVVDFGEKIKAYVRSTNWVHQIQMPISPGGNLMINVCMLVLH